MPEAITESDVFPDQLRDAVTLVIGDGDARGDLVPDVVELGDDDTSDERDDDGAADNVDVETALADDAVANALEEKDAEPDTVVHAVRDRVPGADAESVSVTVDDALTDRVVDEKPVVEMDCV